jgi:hypothetical protein
MKTFSVFFLICLGAGMADAQTRPLGFQSVKCSSADGARFESCGNGANVSTVDTLSVPIVAANVAQQLPSQAVPDGKEAVFRAAATNIGTVKLAESDIAVGFSLSAGEAISLSVTNTDVLFVKSTSAGDIMEIITESAK